MNKKKIFTIILILIALLIVLFIALRVDWLKTWRLIKQARLIVLLAAIFTTIISYSLSAVGFILVTELFTRSISRRQLFTLSLTSTVIDFVLSIGGVSGGALRILFLKKQGLRLQHIFNALLLYYFLLTFISLLYLLISLQFLIHQPILINAVAKNLANWLVVILIVILVLTLFLLNNKIQLKIYLLLKKIYTFFTGQPTMLLLDKLHLALFDLSRLIKSNPNAIIKCLIVLLSDWLMCIATVYLCFTALNTKINFLVVLSGFMIGLNLGKIIPTPGGIGTEDGPMIAIYQLFNLSLEQAVAATALFRLIYYLLPLSLVLISIPIKSIIKPNQAKS